MSFTVAACHIVIGHVTWVPNSMFGMSHLACYFLKWIKCLFLTQIYRMASEDFDIVHNSHFMELFVFFVHLGSIKHPQFSLDKQHKHLIFVSLNKWVGITVSKWWHDLNFCINYSFNPYADLQCHVQYSHFFFHLIGHVTFENQ